MRISRKTRSKRIVPMEGKNAPREKEADRETVPFAYPVAWRDFISQYRRKRCILQLTTTSGLCNHLRAWAGIGALADMQNLPFVVHWHPNWACRARFGELFRDNNCVRMPARRYERLLRLARKFVGRSANRPTCWFSRMLPPARREEHERVALKRMRELKLLPAIQTELDAFMATAPDNLIGLHIRRTDAMKNYGKCVGVIVKRAEDLRPEMVDRRLFPILDRELDENPDATFLLCADNQHSVQLFTSRYRGRMIWRPQPLKRNGKERHSSVRDAVIDLYALSRTQRIIGTLSSSFSFYAATLGGIPLDRY
jgi:hypothetical protein